MLCALKTVVSLLNVSFSLLRKVQVPSMLKVAVSLALTSWLLFSAALQADTLKVFTWEGYFHPKEVKAVNQLLHQKGYRYQVEIIEPWAEGPEQMFNVMRSGRADITFLTLNYMKMQHEKLMNLLQPINTRSPRLTNYSQLAPELVNIPMGMKDDQVYYIPWAGGAYGIWANMDKLTPEELPVSVNDLWQARWKGKLSLSSGQIQPNIALAAMAMGQPPFFINDIQDYNLLSAYLDANSTLQVKLNQLYRQVAMFWNSGPVFYEDVVLVASYGPGASVANAQGGNWRLIQFKEGNTLWLDTINFHKHLTGRKLEAAEIFANYFIGQQVQQRAAREFGLVPASRLVAMSGSMSGSIDQSEQFFQTQMFWPPYRKAADNVMKMISDKALAERDKEFP